MRLVPFPPPSPLPLLGESEGSVKEPGEGSLASCNRGRPISSYFREYSSRLSPSTSSWMGWRGTFTESFALFGFDLRAYEALFEERLGLFAALLSQEPFTWERKLRPPLKDQPTCP